MFIHYQVILHQPPVCINGPKKFLIQAGFSLTILNFRKVLLYMYEHSYFYVICEWQPPGTGKSTKFSHKKSYRPVLSLNVTQRKPKAYISYQLTIISCSIYQEILYNLLNRISHYYDHNSLPHWSILHSQINLSHILTPYSF